MRTELPKIVTAEYTDTYARYGPNSPEMELVRARYAHIKGFREFANAFDSTKRALGNEPVEAEATGGSVDMMPLLEAASLIAPCRVIVRAGALPHEVKGLRWRLGVGLIRLGVSLLGDHASFQRFDLDDSSSNSQSNNQSPGEIFVAAFRELSDGKHNDALASESLAARSVRA